MFPTKEKSEIVDMELPNTVVVLARTEIISSHFVCFLQMFYDSQQVDFLLKNYNSV